MRDFLCPNCGQHLTFENSVCLSCGSAIGFSLPEAGAVSLLVFDVNGRLVRTLASGPQAAGAHTVSWNGRDDRGQAVPSGIYLYQLTANGATTTRRMTLLK